MSYFGHHGLQRISDIAYKPRYFNIGLVGASKWAWLDSRALSSLADAETLLSEMSTPRRRLGLLVWDAYRSKTTQQAIFNQYVKDLLLRRSVSAEEAETLAVEFVSRPSGVFPHGTGGAVDLTLLVNGSAALMGTDFDDFSARAYRDWHIRNPPKTAIERQVQSNRELLEGAMLEAGFVGLQSEWWHYEWGTKTWANAMGTELILDRIYDPPGAALT